MTSTSIPFILSEPRQSLSLGISAVIRRILRIPLVLKVMGANAIIVASALILVGGGLWGDDQGQFAVVLGALTIACVVNLILVRLALSPIAELERISDRVSRGEFGARVSPSLVADTELLRLTVTVNSLLDSLAAERRRIQKLGSLVVSAQDTERARLSRELHDSIAQTLAGAGFQLSAAIAGAADDDTRNTLATTRAMIGKAMEEVRNISYSLHPRVAEDLGLVPALEFLAHRIGERGTLKVSVTADIGARNISAADAATLFRVAQVSLQNAEGRTRKGAAEILLYTGDGTVCLVISDDCDGMDTDTRNDDNFRNDLSSVIDRVTLGGGIMRVEQRRSGGTRVITELRCTGTTG